MVYDGFAVADLPLAWMEKHEELLRMEFHPNSRLIKINGCPGEQNCGFYDYVMVEGKGERLHLLPDPDPYSTLVYAARGSDVRTTIVGGDVLVDEFAPTRVDPAGIAAEARAAARALAARAGL